ncbi:putative RNA methyltransferase [Geomonas silvestris]|uniref:Putative RNA methyltransferase n=1 Tax=Geomonas silvestris TaxID=2740184 RepID=A0A6V8MIZ6_9BACT|nr:23S rRNA (uracil(1939)-C(5))-methyltransferase RlmD [Geomonas silvestris]GFO59927.1 putative RNA methyltransferase [Geomonas silvestris]
MAEAEITIEKLSYGGAGFGRLEGKACFVPFTAPGDRVRIGLVKEKRSFVEGELLELCDPSPLRVAAPCPVFGRCGGCDWQFLPYAEQLAQKGAIFSETLQRIGRVPSEAVLPVLPSPNEYGYRSRIQLKLAHLKERSILGFFQAGSHRVVDASCGCQIADPLLNRMADQFRALLLRLPKVRALSQIDLSIGADDQGIAVVHLEPGAAGALKEAFSARRAELPSVSGLFLRSGAKARVEKVFGIESLAYRVPAGFLPGSPELVLRFGRGGFSQVNYPQNLELIAAVHRFARLSGTERVLDLYCGNGNISLPLATYAASVLGVEGYAPSIEDARANAAANGIANARFEVGDVARVVGRLATEGERFDLVVLDPPRSGAEAAGEIARLAPWRIVYVSCDPPTLARDLALLAENGYRVAASQPVDMFPQTYHLESVTLLERL